MNHKELVAEVVGRAQARGLLVHYCPDSRRCEGTRGMPDVFAAGKHGAAWFECKTEADVLDPDQTTWKHTLIAAGQTVIITRPRDLELVDGVLDQLT